MKAEKKIRYLICANQRTGSTLLRNLLFNTGIFPKAYEVINPSRRMDVKTINWEKEDLKEFFEKIFESMKLPNEVSGFTMMWYQIERLVSVINETEKYKGVSVEDMHSFLPSDLKYIWVKRKDKVRQGVSYLKAKQTGIYTLKIKRQKVSKSDLVFDLVTLDSLIDEYKRRELMWGEFFRRNKIRPLVLEYEDFIKDFRGTVVKVLDYLGIPVPENLVVKTSLVKQSDALSEGWVKRYYDEMVIRKRIYLGYIKLARKIINSIYRISYKLKKHFPFYKKFIKIIKGELI